MEILTFDYRDALLIVQKLILDNKVYYRYQVSWKYIFLFKFKHIKANTYKYE